MNIQNILLWLEGRYETLAPRVSGVVNNSLFHSGPHINQTLHQIIHILHFCLVDSLQNYAPDFIANWIDQGCSVATNLEVHTVTTIS